MAHQTTSMRARGFTLIELMITVAIVAILASIALPAYRDSVLKGRRAQGRTALLELAQAQERWFTANNTYVAFAAGATVNGMKTFSGDNPTNAAYRLSSAACGSAAITECALLTAVPQQADPDGGSLTLTTTGVKACTNANKPAVCWP